MNAAQARGNGVRLRNGHVRALQPRAQHFHDARRHLADVVVAKVDVLDHDLHPVKTGINMGVEGCGDSGRDRESDKWGQLLEVAWVDADENFVEE